MEVCDQRHAPAALPAGRSAKSSGYVTQPYTHPTQYTPDQHTNNINKR